MNLNRNILIAGIVGVIVVGGAIWWLFLLIGGSGGFGHAREDGRGAEGNPIQVTLDFYDSWLEARNSEAGDPFALDLQNNIALASEVSTKLSEYAGKLEETEIDPVLCQSAVPGGMRSSLVYQKENEAQVLILASSKDMAGQAVVTLEGADDFWTIVDITCGFGEQDPNQGEFSFDKQGYLLKSVPAPLDSNYWHVVFEQDGVFGHAVPLYLDASSICVDTSGAEMTCNTDMFSETMSVHVQGDMTETGLNVKRVEFQE